MVLKHNLVPKQSNRNYLLFNTPSSLTQTSLLFSLSNHHYNHRNIIGETNCHRSMINPKFPANVFEVWVGVGLVTRFDLVFPVWVFFFFFFLEFVVESSLGV